jgi:hypothetical protein
MVRRKQKANRADPLKVIRPFRGEVDLEGLWAPSPAFLVCSGPSLQDHPLDRLRERGVVSLGINNAAAFAPIKAWAFSDPQYKFHHGLFLDPAVMTFAPVPKLKRRIYLKDDDGWHETGVRVRECPNTYGFDRSNQFVPEKFFSTTFAHWGPGSKQPTDRPISGPLCTMLLGIRLLHYLGVRRIYLLGVDFQSRDGLRYGFPDGTPGRNGRYVKEQRLLELLAPELVERGMELFNCAIDNRLGLFPYRPFHVAIEDCKGSVPPEPFDTHGWYGKKKTRDDAERLPKIVPRFFQEVP